MPERVRGSVSSAGPAATRPQEELTDALLAASRALIGLAARSLADLDADVTLPQFRALVVLAYRGPQRIGDISAELGVNASTGTRMCERLLRKGLIRRRRLAEDRRAVELTLSPDGAALVEQVIDRRRTALGRIVETLPEDLCAPATAALRTFAETSGEPAEREWWLGWHHDDLDGTD